MTSTIQRSFAGGEIAPSLHARADQTKYATGLRTCRNFIVHKHGGVSNRPGTEYVGVVKDQTRKTRLVAFKFNIAQTYALEFGHNYIRFIQGGADLLVTNADAPAWSGATNYTHGDLVTSAGTRYRCILAHINFLPPNATYWHALSGDILEVPTTYAEADLPTVKFEQSADVMTISHPSYVTANLSRFTNVKWTLTPEVFTPDTAAPAGNSAVNGTAGATVYRYKVTAISDETGEESLPSASFSCTGGIPTLAAPNVITIGSVAGASNYYVYKEITPGNGTYAWIGIAGGLTFNDNNITPLSGERPPELRDPFTGAGNYPAVVAYYQGRRIYAATTNNPELVVMSKSDIYNNLMVSTPLRDDDSVVFSLAGKSVNKVVGMVGLRTLVMLTEESEWTVNGNASGVITPGEPNPVRQSDNGAADLHPLLIGSEILYVQTHRTVVHSLGFDLTTDGYKGDDITLFATHLFKGKQIVDWAYSKTPDSIVWVITDDGSLLALTYIKSQQLWGWHRHDSAAGAEFESVCCVQEGKEDVVYFTVKRTIDGVVKRYKERLHSREVLDVAADAYFVDCGLSYDGRNVTATTITITGGTLWNHTEDLTATASASYFTAGDVGNQIVLDDGTGVKQKFNITGYTSPTVVTVRSVNNVGVSYRATAYSNFSIAVDSISGLGHLEGEALSILADGYVVANGIDAPLKVVSSGAIASLGGHYSVIHAGLPIQADMETLALDTDNDQNTLLNKESLVTDVDIMVESSRGIFAGPDADHLLEYKQRTDEGYNELTELATGKINIGVNSTYCEGGGVFIRQQDPLPLTVLAIIPNGNLGGSN